MVTETRAAKIDAIDISPEAIGYARKYYQHKRIRFESGNALKVDLEPVGYDVIVSFETIGHVPDATVLLQQFCRFLRPGGY